MTLIEKLKEIAAEQKEIAQKNGMHLSSPASKAWLALGLEELRSAVHPTTQQVGQVSAPGIWGVPTTGEATAERMAEKGEELPAQETYEVPKAPKEKKSVEMDR